MYYDFDGNEVVFSGGDNENGYTMVNEPTWTDSKLIVAASSPSSIGSVGEATAVLAASDYIDVMGKNSLFITMVFAGDTVPPSYGLCFYDKNKQPMNTSDTNAFWGRGANDPRAKVAEVFVPQGAAYFRTTWWSASALAEHPETPPFTYTFTAGRFENCMDAITHERPASRGMLNAIRRARQLTDIKWTPRVRVPRYCKMDGASDWFLDWCEVGKEYTAIPYSGSGRPAPSTYETIDPNSLAGRWGYSALFLGLYTDIETFITAARFPNSIMAERANVSTPTYDMSVYGTVCSALLFHALGLAPPVWPLNGSFITSTSYGRNYFTDIGTLSNLSANQLHLCDVLCDPRAHVAIITDLVRDANGNVTGIEVSEATTLGNPSNGSADGEELGGMSRRKVWTFADLLGYFGSYGVHRFKSFTAIPYVRSSFVDTGNELDAERWVDLPCIPYMGNKFRYKVGYIVNTKILIGATGFTSMTVLKDGATFGTFDITGLTEVSVGFSAVGSYSAYLTKSGGVKTMSCEWTVV